MAKFSLVAFKPESAPRINLVSEIHSNDESIFVSYRIDQGFELVDTGNSTPNKNRILKLWEKTCFELFIKNENGSYIEFNFSPNFEWNCFYFQKKGDSLSELKEMQMPELDILLSKDHFLLFAKIKKEFFPEGFFDRKQTLNVGISSVIKDNAKSLSYWALTHCDSRPNFHHFDSFIYKF
jgi:hypothetical protein